VVDFPGSRYIGDGREGFIDRRSASLRWLCAPLREASAPTDGSVGLLKFIITVPMFPQRGESRAGKATSRPIKYRALVGHTADTGLYMNNPRVSPALPNNKRRAEWRITACLFSWDCIGAGDRGHSFQSALVV